MNIFVTLFSGTVRHRRLEFSTHVNSGWWYRVYRNQAAAAYSSLFFFLSNFHTLTIFVILPSGIVRCTKLKLGIRGDNELMYRVYWNQAVAFYSSLYFFIFLSLQLSNIKFFLRNCEA